MTEKAPTYEEIVSYCADNGLIGKVDTAKFYDFYAKQNFTYRGAIMDWQGKLKEWAERQRGTVQQSAMEYNVLNKTQKGKKRFMNGTMTDLEYLKWLERVVDTWKEKVPSNA